MSRFLVQSMVGLNLTVECLDCGERKSFPKKGYGRIASQIFQQDHTCKERKRA